MGKLIDRFNRLAIFDKFFILIAVLGVLFVGFLLFRKSTFVTVTVKVDEESIQYEPWRANNGSRSWFALMFYEGMKEQDGLGRTMSEVMSVRSYDTGPAVKAVYLNLNVRGVYNRASDQYTFKGVPLLVGATIDLKLDHLKVRGLVIGVEGQRDPRQKVKLQVKTKIKEESATFPGSSGTRDYVADAIVVGDEIVDSQNNVIVRVVDMLVENAVRTVVTDKGEVLIRRDPIRKDVSLTFEVNATKLGELYYMFDDIPILVGHGLPLNFSTVSVFPDVTNITVAE